MNTLARLTLTLTVLLPAASPAASYHLDSATGDDANDGLSPAHAWRSIDRANAAPLAAGDRLLLRAGSSWEAVTLQPHGSGSPDHPIAIDSYGDGPPPALHCRGRVPVVLRLHNQQYWDIANLEITNHADSPGQRVRGIEIHATDAGILHHIHCTNLFIHDINAASDYTNDGDTTAKSFGGLATLIDGKATPTSWDDLLVDHCTFQDVGPIGLLMTSSWLTGHRTNDPAHWAPSHHVIIRNSTFQRIARNGLIVRGCVAPLIEHNLFRACAIAGSGNASFCFHCDDALFQFNEACNTKYNPGDADAAGFDSDYNCRRTVFQFNYSHDNDYGFILLCCNGAGGFNEGTIVRYNISQNDGGNIIRLAGPVKSSRIYNNTIYVGPHTTSPRAAEPPHIIYHKSWSGWSDDTTFANNVILNDSPNALYDPGQSTANHYDHNLFAGLHPTSEPTDPHKLATDPKFTGPPGTASTRDDAARIYIPFPNSPLLGAGIPLPTTNPNLHDFAGHPILIIDNRIDLGALSPPR